MLYEVTYENNGRTGKQGVRMDADATSQEVVAEFVRRWEENGDKFTGSAWVSGSMVESN